MPNTLLSQLRDFDEDMCHASVPRHEISYESHSDPSFQYFQSFQPQNVFREGKNIYKLFNTTTCPQTEKSVLDELDLCAREIRSSSCQFTAFTKLMIDVEDDIPIVVDQIHDNLQLVNGFVQTLLDAHRENPLIHDLEIRSDLGFCKTYRLYYLKPAILQKETQRE